MNVQHVAQQGGQRSHVEDLVGKGTAARQERQSGQDDSHKNFLFL